MTTTDNLYCDVRMRDRRSVPNWEAIDDNADALPHYWHETKRRIERRRLFAQLAAALLACVTMFAAGFYCGMIGGGL